MLEGNYEGAAFECIEVFALFRFAALLAQLLGWCCAGRL